MVCEAYFYAYICSHHKLHDEQSRMQIYIHYIGLILLNDSFKPKREYQNSSWQEDQHVASVK